ncbi:MAG: hypothetical protein P8M30_14640 [Planctomycetaceae bacterium]|nr:hypothetical protein [Planctomycetaceae bacterium]
MANCSKEIISENEQIPNIPVFFLADLTIDPSTGEVAKHTPSCFTQIIPRNESKRLLRFFRMCRLGIWSNISAVARSGHFFTVSSNRRVIQKKQKALWLKLQGLLLLLIVSTLLILSLGQLSSEPNLVEAIPEPSRNGTQMAKVVHFPDLDDKKDLAVSTFSGAGSMDSDPEYLSESEPWIDYQSSQNPSSAPPLSIDLSASWPAGHFELDDYCTALAQQSLGKSDLLRGLRGREHLKAKAPAISPGIFQSKSLQEFTQLNSLELALRQSSRAEVTESNAPRDEDWLASGEFGLETVAAEPQQRLIDLPPTYTANSDQALGGRRPHPTSMTTPLPEASEGVTVEYSLDARINEAIDSGTNDEFHGIREEIWQSAKTKISPGKAIQWASFQADGEAASKVTGGSASSGRPNDTAVEVISNQDGVKSTEMLVAAVEDASTEDAIVGSDYAEEGNATLDDRNAFEPVVQSGIIEEPNFDTVLPLQPSARMALMQVAESNAPAPTQDTSADGTTKAGDEKTAEGTDPTQNAPAPAKNPDHHMVSELIGSGYGCISRVFDSGFYVANELTLLAPQTVGNVKVGVTDQLATTTVSESSERGFGFGNRLTLGIRGQYSGLQCQYWAFASENVLAESWQKYRPIPRFLTSSTAELETLDLVITQRLCLFGCRWESGFGGRYAKYNGEDTATIVDQMHDSLELTGLARATRHLRGAGPVLALSGRRNLRFGFLNDETGLPPDLQCEACGHDSCMGTCNSWRTASACFPWTIYWNGKVSWLWAEESGAALTEAIVAQNAGSSGAATARSRDKALIFDDQESSFLTLGFQVGLEYSCPVFCRSQFIARVGFEYQYWDLGGNVAESQSFAFLTDDSTFGGRIDALASSNRTSLTLSGATFLIGLNY